MTSALLKLANGLHVALYRMSGGKFANKIANLPILLITTFGRKSGKPYTNLSSTSKMVKIIWCRPRPAAPIRIPAGITT